MSNPHFSHLSLRCLSDHFPISTSLPIKKKARSNFNRICIVILIGPGHNQPEPMKMLKPCGKPPITGRSAGFGCRLGQIMRFQKATARPHKRKRIYRRILRIANQFHFRVCGMVRRGAALGAAFSAKMATLSDFFLVSCH